MNEQPNSDPRPDWIKNNEVGSGFIEYQGERIPYTILKKEAEPRLPGFLGFPNGQNLFISEEVPEQFGYSQLIHEFIEFTELSGKEGRCLEALKRELKLVPEEIKREYLKYRRDFFANLVNYYKNSSDENFKKILKKRYRQVMSI